MQDGKDYFARRAAQEREAALRATDSRARESHLELAKRYEEAAQGVHRRPANDHRGPAVFPGLKLI